VSSFLTAHQHIIGHFSAILEFWNKYSKSFTMNGVYFIRVDRNAYSCKLTELTQSESVNGCCLVYSLLADSRATINNEYVADILLIPVNQLVL